MKKNQSSIFYFALSLAITTFGVALTILMALRPSLQHFQTLAQRSPIGALYGILCLVGITAVFYPAKCRGLFQHVQDCPTEVTTHSNPMQIKGHHPDCQNFSCNRINFGKQTFCAACAGLLIGATVALAGAALYFSGILKIDGGSIWLVALGEILMLGGLIQIKFGGGSKIVLNAVFVIGSFVTLVEVDALVKSLLSDLYVFGLILFLLYFRIWLSEWNNKRTCSRCQSCLC